MPKEVAAKQEILQMGTVVRNNKPSSMHRGKTGVIRSLGPTAARIDFPDGGEATYNYETMQNYFVIVSGAKDPLDEYV